MLQADLNTFYQWSVDLQLCFDVGKSSILRFGQLNPSHLYKPNRDHTPAKTLKKIWVLLYQLI